MRNLASCGVAHSKSELKNIAEIEQVCGMKILQIKNWPKKEKLNELLSGQKSTKTQHSIKIIATLVLKQR